MSEENVQLVKDIYARWERGDFSETDWAHPEILFEVPGPDPEVRGVEAMSRSWTGWLQVYSDLSIEATAYYDKGDTVVTNQAFMGGAAPAVFRWTRSQVRASSRFATGRWFASVATQTSMTRSRTPGSRRAKPPRAPS